MASGTAGGDPGPCSGSCRLRAGRDMPLPVAFHGPGPGIGTRESRPSPDHSDSDHRHGRYEGHNQLEGLSRDIRTCHLQIAGGIDGSKQTSLARTGVSFVAQRRVASMLGSAY